jgi:hypothetical protein
LAVHPGGRSILDAVEGAVGGTQDQLNDSHAVLRDYGNMSSATVMFVLKRMLGRFRSDGIGGNALGCAVAFGPGLMAESIRSGWPRHKQCGRPAPVQLRCGTEEQNRAGQRRGVPPLPARSASVGVILSRAPAGAEGVLT